MRQDPWPLDEARVAAVSSRRMDEGRLRSERSGTGVVETLNTDRLVIRSPVQPQPAVFGQDERIDRGVPGLTGRPREYGMAKITERTERRCRGCHPDGHRSVGDPAGCVVEQVSALREQWVWRPHVTCRPAEDPVRWFGDRVTDLVPMDQVRRTQDRDLEEVQVDALGCVRVVA